MTSNTLFTIGHSTHDASAFLNLLKQNRITAVADVRSSPFSRFAPQFNREAVNHLLDVVGIKYVFMGKELGARSDKADCYIDGRVQFELLAKTPEFNHGIERLLSGALTERIAIMCAEQEPLDCHRTVLVARVLVSRSSEVHHIHGDGHIESHANAMKRLMVSFGLHQPDLFRTADERLAEALSRQESRIAFVNDALRIGGTM